MRSVLAALEPGADRTAGSDDRVHQGWRAMARRARSVWRIVHRPRLDQRSRGRRDGVSARASRCRTIWIRRCCLPMRSSFSASAEAVVRAAEVQLPATFSTSAHGIVPATPPEMSLRWSRQSIAKPRSPRRRLIFAACPPGNRRRPALAVVLRALDNRRKHSDPKRPAYAHVMANARAERAECKTVPVRPILTH